MREDKHMGKRVIQKKTMLSLLLRGCLLSLAGIFFLLAVPAGLIWWGWLPQRCMEGGVLLSCAGGILFGGLLTAGKMGKKKLLAAMMIGGITFLLLLLSGCLLYGRVDGGAAFREGAACLCGGVLAGLLSGNGRKGRRA